MPLLPSRPTQAERLYYRGCLRVRQFCKVNGLILPVITRVRKEDWHVSACAYYRPDTEKMRKWTKTGINICLEECARPCSELQTRNWNWPGSTTDREPYGVVCHELGHHADWSKGVKKWEYGSEYCEQVMKESGEDAITSYCPNPAEWFAEIYRLWVTNHALLQYIRPKTWEILRRDWTPVSKDDWKEELGEDCPARVIKALERKGR